MDKQNIPEKSLLEEVVDDLIIRVDTMENREVKIPDYGTQFESLENLIKSSLPKPDHNKNSIELNSFLEQQRMISGQVQNLISEVMGIVSNLPKSIPVKHSLDIKAKGLTIAIAFVFVILAFLAGYCIHLWGENGRLEANDSKYRAIRQTAPQWTHWADTTYARDPAGMMENTIKLENEAMEKSEAEVIAKQKANDAKTAQQHLMELKKKHFHNSEKN